jgi:hypothetical protein
VAVHADLSDKVDVTSDLTSNCSLFPSPLLRPIYDSALLAVGARSAVTW